MIKGNPGRKRVKLNPGDILAVPREKSGYYFLIYITTNRFGYAFGLFTGHGELSDVSATCSPTPYKYPVYSGKELIANGRWQRIGNRKDLLVFFPEDPPIYHSKVSNVNDDRIGPHGCAETASEGLTDLTEAEAEEIGLEKWYRQVMLEESVEDHLKLLFG